jgi:hypothetical protein
MIAVKDTLCKMKNIRENLIQDCTMIQAYQLEQLLKDDKIKEIIAWNIELKKGATDNQINEEINRLLREFPKVLNTRAMMPPDRGSNNFKIWLVAGVKLKMRRHG